MSRRTGDLEFGKVGVGKEVICISLPDMRIWEDLFPLQAWIKPKIGLIYRLRSNALVMLDDVTVKGILLQGIHNPQVKRNGMAAEPCFPCNAFCAR